MRFFLILCALIGQGLAFAASSGSDGLILSFEAGSDVRLLSVSTVDRVAPPRSFEKLSWSVAAVDGAGALSWTRAFPAPRAFDAGAVDAVTFSIAVPRLSIGSRIVIRDERGSVRWQQTFDGSMLASAESSGAKIARAAASARESTARLASSTSSEILLRQIERQPPNADAATPRLDRGTQKAIAPTKDLATAGMSTSTFRVTGSVVDAGPIIVRAYDASNHHFVLSTEQDWWSQRFELPLAAGNYIFEFDDNLENIGSDFFYRTPTRTEPIHITTDTELAEIRRDDASGEFSLLARVPCALLLQESGLPAYADTWATSADNAHLERHTNSETLTGSGTTGMCNTRYWMQLSPGIYTIEIAPLGWESQRFENVEIVAGQQSEMAATFEEDERTLVWRGNLVDAAHRPFTDVAIFIHDQMQDYAATANASGGATFVVPYRKGWIAEFIAFPRSASDSSVRHVQLMDGGALPSTVVIDDIPLQSTLENGLLRLYGNGDRDKHFNILFLANGYTDVSESYTDVNGNGQWDGIAWYDLNGDGVYNAPDIYGVYGNPSSYPEVGFDPTSVNEPFDDINGDGALSLDDPALFLINAREFMRSLLGSDFWSSHRDAFNAYALFEPSPQAGYSVVSDTGEMLLTRNTLYSATLDQARYLMSVDRTAALERALTALPEVDLVVVLVNQVVLQSTRGNVTISQPGVMVYPVTPPNNFVNAMTPSHEMGHFIGALCDEYSEFTGVDPATGSTSSGCPNVSYTTNLAYLPWAGWLPPGQPVPSRNLDASLGVYEGADYYPGGAYRPSYRSVMRDLSPLFNAPSRAALETAVRNRTGHAAHGHSSHRRVDAPLRASDEARSAR